MSTTPPTNTFKFPSIYKFPPFFTKQVHQDTANTQLTIWCKLILEYCEFYKIWILDFNGEPVIKQDEFSNDDTNSDIPKESLFHNTEIKRSLKPEFVKEIVKLLSENGNLEMINDQQFYVYHKTLEELSNSLLQWVENTGQQNSILTLYELSNGELTRHEFLHNIDQNVLLKIINRLVAKKRAVILRDEDNQIMGVKIL